LSSSTQSVRRDYDAVLFDLDGTLVDTAPDMIAALQSLQQAKGYAPVDYEIGRSNVSNGAAGLLRIGFPDLDETARSELTCEFIARYKKDLCSKTSIFPGIDLLLDALDTANLSWGVVTNKPAHLTHPLLATLGLAQRCACIVSGDTLKTRKPDPAPMLHACELVNVSPQRTVYVGDAVRDIEAGQAVGMMTVAAAYGYITDDDNPAHWNADSIASNPDELAKIVFKAVNLVT
jgi:2-phosphoglycolate phosphatase